ncbi:MAG: hypothetical protein K6T31_03510 [Alicyclobacillus sp.]|nr:hypothetical protein [Alicyclobacillus sp.]
MTRERKQRIVQLDTPAAPDPAAGMTLPEVLAAVVAGSLLVSALLYVVDGFGTQAALDEQRRTAGAIAQNVLTNMASAGTAAVFQQGPVQVQAGGILYTVTTGPVTSPPSWMAPALSANYVDAQVNVTWNTTLVRRASTQTVSVNQLFPP